MFSYEKRIKAVKLLVQYDMSYAQTIRELGYPTRTALTNWYKEYSKHDDLLKKIKQSMTGHGFLQNIAIYLCKEYFETYGLIYETQRNEISSGENILKVLSLFEKIGKVEKIEIKKIGVLANEIYYNNGEHRLNNIKQSIQKNLINWIQEYD